jgi:hypothetical protein
MQLFSLGVLLCSVEGDVEISMNNEVETVVEIAESGW